MQNSIKTSSLGHVTRKIKIEHVVTKGNIERKRSRSQLRIKVIFVVSEI